MNPRRDLVRAAVDRWDEERRERRRTLKGQRGRRAVFFGFVAILLLFLIQSDLIAPSSAIVLAPGEVAKAPGETPSRHQAVALAESRVMGLMAGRRLKSRDRARRVAVGVSHLSEQIGRKRAGR